MFRSGWFRILLGFMVVLSVGGGYAFWLSTTRAAYLLRQGQAALLQGDWDEAERVARRLEQRGYPQHGHLLRGEVHLRAARGLLARTPAAGPLDAEPAQREARAQDAFRQTLAELARIRDEGPLALEATLLAAECLVRLGEHRLAVEALTAVVKRHPDQKDAHQWLAAVYMDLRSPPEAIRHLQAWGRLDSGDGRPYRWIGFFHRDYHQQAEAIEAYREALRRQLEPPARAEVVKELAATLIAWEAQYHQALETLDQCPPPWAQDAELLALRAECLWGLGRPTEAVDALESALQANPDLSRGLLLRGKMYLTGDQPAAAVPFLEKAVLVDPHDDRSRDHLVQAYQQLGQTARAEQHQRLLQETKSLKDKVSQLEERALSRPGDDRLRQQVAGLYRKLNRPAEARMWLQAALACNPANQEARQELAQLALPAGAPAQPWTLSIK
ncbi:MAG: tetratricopeptide repeat protein [Gemmataceae bacterium]|nr:tetratricopeptide repeat protein [Gemmataceae bacterium]